MPYVITRANVLSRSSYRRRRIGRINALFRERQHGNRRHGLLLWPKESAFVGADTPSGSRCATRRPPSPLVASPVTALGASVSLGAVPSPIPFDHLYQCLLSFWRGCRATRRRACALFEVRENAFDDGGVFEGSDDLDVAAAIFTACDVDLKHALETLRPGHGSLTFGRR